MRTEKCKFKFQVCSKVTVCEQRGYIIQGYELPLPAKCGLPLSSPETHSVRRYLKKTDHLQV